MKIAKAQPNEAAKLTGIALAAKGHWGYPTHWLSQWKDQLTITSSYMETHPTYAAVLESGTVGFFAISPQGDAAYLDHLWVLPAAMGNGIGRALFKHAEQIARNTGATCLKIVSDPNTESFYLHMGAIRRGLQPAPMDGQERYLPFMEKELAQSPS